MKRFGLPLANDENRNLQNFQQMQHSLEVDTYCKTFLDISEQVSDWLSSINAVQGLLTLFVCHTSASLVVQENADITVQYDLLDALDRLAPESKEYRHNSEGPDDMPGHIKSMITSTSLSIPVDQSKAVLGQWQGIYLVEHRNNGSKRKIVMQYQGTSLST